MKTILGSNVYGAWATQSQAKGFNHSNGNVKFEGDTLHSYESWPVGVVRPWGFWINGDATTVTTGQHRQGALWAARKIGKPVVIIPMSALRRANIVPQNMGLVDTEPDREIAVPCHRSICYDQTPKHAHNIHLLGRAVISAEDQYYLSGTDETGLNPWNSYFLTALPGPVSSIFGALETLKPDAVREAEAVGQVVLRQGEWFFIPTAKPPRGTIVDKHYFLRHRDPNRRARHLASKLAVLDGPPLVSGTVRHTAREHRMLSLGADWYTAHENMGIRSYTSIGRVD